jgi:hypothetical protein
MKPKMKIAGTKIEVPVSKIENIIKIPDKKVLNALKQRDLTEADRKALQRQMLILHKYNRL